MESAVNSKPDLIIRSRRRTRFKSKLCQVNAQRLGVGAQTFLLDCLESAGGDAEVYPTFALRPPKTTVLQIGLLQFLGSDVGMAHSHAVIGASTGELAHPRHVVVLLLEVVQI